MTIKELHDTVYPGVSFSLMTNKGKEIELDREDETIMQSFGDVVIATIESDLENGLRIIPKMQLIKKSEV